MHSTTHAAKPADIGLYMVRRVVGSILHGGHIELFLVPASDAAKPAHTGLHTTSKIFLTSFLFNLANLNTTTLQLTDDGTDLRSAQSHHT